VLWIFCESATKCGLIVVVVVVVVLVLVVAAAVVTTPMTIHDDLLRPRLKCICCIIISERGLGPWDPGAQSLRILRGRHGRRRHCRRRRRRRRRRSLRRRLALPCLALPCLALHCLALPCLALPCFALPCLGKAIGHIHFQPIWALSPAPSRTGS
jgi:hypothetical protein